MSQSTQFSALVDKQLSKSLGAIPIVLPILQRLNLASIINQHCPSRADVDCGTVALILVLNRLLSPKPMYKIADWAAETVLPETLEIEAEKLHDRRLGDLLDDLHPHLSEIWRQLIHQAINSYQIPIEFVHYDVTSIYFEGIYTEAEKIEYGYSRDGKPDCKQVNLALNVTGDDAIPLAYRVLNGSTADKTTPLENMRGLQQLLASAGGQAATDDALVIVSDQAMLNPDVIVTYQKQGIGYLGPLPRQKAYESVLMSVTTEDLLNHPLAYRPQNQKETEPPIYCGVLTTIPIVSKKTKESVIAEALILHSRNKAKLDREKRQTLLNRYLQRLRVIAGYLNKRKYRKAGYTHQQINKAQRRYQSVKSLVSVELRGGDGALHLVYDLNIKAVMQAAQRDGRYLLVTNRPLSAEQMLTRFKAQDQVEKRNRTIKGPIQIRPLFLHNPTRIESLILICMVALLAFALLEQQAKRAGMLMTGRRLIEQFASVSAIYTVFTDGSGLKTVVPLTRFQLQFLDQLNLPSVDVYLNPVRI